MSWMRNSISFGTRRRNSVTHDDLERALGPHFRNQCLAATGRGETSGMALIRVKPTAFDITIADTIAARTGRPAEHVAEALTWGADEHVICALAVGCWLYARSSDAQMRRASDHVLLTTLVAAVVPHVLKSVFDQERPDRLTARGHLCMGFRYRESVSTLSPPDTRSTSALWVRQQPCCLRSSETRYGRSGALLCSPALCCSPIGRRMWSPALPSGRSRSAC
jgi:hypothetical protein